MLELVWENLLATGWIERIAFISLTMYVILATREIPLAWPVSMIGVACYFYLAADAGLYGELPLQVFYFLISLYGWYHWQKGVKKRRTEVANPLDYAEKKTVKVPVTKMKPKDWGITIAVVTVATVILGFLLDTYSDSDVAYWDSFTTSASIAGTFMQARKKLENWIIWLVVDTIYVWLFWYKELPLLSLLNLIYIGLATYGLINWYASMKRAKNANA